MQLFVLMNTILAQDPACAQRGLTVRCVLLSIMCGSLLLRALFSPASSNALVA